jgi:hypothetical protein
MEGMCLPTGFAMFDEISYCTESLGFNMENSLAIQVTWGAFLVDGNHLTNLMSIGSKSSLTGPDPPAPAIVGGLNTHGVFEGDLNIPKFSDDY